MTQAAAYKRRLDDWLAGAPCAEHDTEHCTGCMPRPVRATAETKPKQVSSRKEAVRGRVWAPPPSTPHVYWDSVKVGAAPAPEAQRRAQTWRLDRELRHWQEAALAAWEDNGRRGVIEAATGTGKTMVAMAAVATVRSEHGASSRVVVVVPTQALAAQWAKELVSTLGIDPSLVCQEHSAAPRPTARAQVIVTVINSARSRLAERIDRWERGGNRVLLVVDECHRAGSEHNAAVVQTKASYSLGLSATPERADGGHARSVYPGLGEPVYRYPLLQALDDGVLAPLRSVNLYIDLTTAERERWLIIGRDLGSALAHLEGEHPGITADPVRMWVKVSRLAAQEDPAAKRVVSLMAQRKALLSDSTERKRCTTAVLDWLTASDTRAMVFHETIDAAESIARDLETRHARVVLDHSQLKTAERATNLQRFRRNDARFLVAVRSLDEGIDVPDASVAVIAAGSRSPRQRIQRLGRILRAAEGKQALAITILVRNTPEETPVGRADAGVLGLGRVVHHRWPGRSVADAIASPSSHQPHRTFEDRVEQLMAAALGVGGQRVKAPVASSGGYVAKAVRFAPNAWHSVAEVRNASGMPADEFDRLRPEIRVAYRLSLDPRQVKDQTVIHGSEIEAIKRLWQSRRRRR